MSGQPVSAQSVYTRFGRRLKLSWLAGHRGADRPLMPPRETPAAVSSLIGHLNFIHPHCVQVVGRREQEYLLGLGKNSLQDALDALCSGTTGLLVVADGRDACPALVERADQMDLPVMGSAAPSETVIEYLGYFLKNALAEKVIVHGVFMDVMGIGVLLTGEAAVGKSELALELITHGHRLIADDAPEFVRVAPETLQGRCPEVLRDFLEVRGLGVLNIRAMFGDNAVKAEKYLRLIVHLEQARSVDASGIDRLRGSRRSRRILDVEIPEIRLPVAAGRNLAVLVEAAARAHILYHNGYDAAEDFITRQQAMIESETP